MDHERVAIAFGETPVTHHVICARAWIVLSPAPPPAPRHDGYRCPGLFMRFHREELDQPEQAVVLNLGLDRAGTECHHASNRPRGRFRGRPRIPETPWMGQGDAPGDW